MQVLPVRHHTLRMAVMLHVIAFKYYIKQLFTPMIIPAPQITFIPTSWACITNQFLSLCASASIYIWCNYQQA